MICGSFASTWYQARHCRMTIWPDSPWSKQPVRWGLSPITIPVFNNEGREMRYELSVVDVPPDWYVDLSWDEAVLDAREERDVKLTVLPDGGEFDGPVVLLFGAMRDKDHRRMLAAFDGRIDRRIYAAPSIYRSEHPGRFAKIRKGTVARSVRDAIARAKRAAGPDGLVVTAGSIFLVSEARAIVKNVRSDPPIAL